MKISMTAAAGSNIRSEFDFFMSPSPFPSMRKIKSEECLTTTCISLSVSALVFQDPIPPPTTTIAQHGVDKEVSHPLVDYKLYIDGIQFGLPVNTMYNKRVVWTDKQLNLKLLRKGVLTRIYAPMTIVQGLRESGVFTSVIAASQSAVNDKVALKGNKTDSDPENVSRRFITSNSRKILNIRIEPANRDDNLSDVPPLSPPGLEDQHGFA